MPHNDGSSTRSGDSSSGSGDLAPVDSTDVPPLVQLHKDGKTKIAERLQKAVDVASPEKNKHRSSDLIPLTEDYEHMKKKLRRLTVVVKSYAEKTKQMNLARDELVNHFAQMSSKSPLYDSIGSELDGEGRESLQQICTSQRGKNTVNQTIKAWKQRHETDTCSLKIVQVLASTQAKVNDYEYQQHVIEYVQEWEKIVTERIERELKEVRKLQSDRSHYEKKVEQLRQKQNDIEAKGKTFPKAQVEKLERNETKLKHAYMIHEANAGRLCVLIEAAVEDGWKDLYHVVKNYINWESNRVGRESDIYCQMSGTLAAMKTTFTKEKGMTGSGSANSPAKAEKKE